MHTIELLAPAGSWEAMVAAIANGANAVYLAGKAFGARRFAGNFEWDELAEAVSYCHVRGVRVYVTVNTLIADAEMNDLMDYVDYLYTIDVDAVIVQDLGVLQRIRTCYPEFEVHGSTQMTAHSAEDVQFLSGLGVSRVVLSRELRLQEIEEIAMEGMAELEVFVHGALCVSYSGQCLMSSMIGGRSGNRGSCAQSCRQMYELVDRATGNAMSSKKEPYLLSPKDLRTIEEILALLKSGAHSLKIEGRMKRPEYAAIVVRAYREAIDAALASQPLDQEWVKKTERIFTRGLTKGFPFNVPQTERMSLDNPGHRGVPVGQVVRYNSKKNEMLVRLHETIHTGDEVRINRVRGNVGARVEYIRLRGQRVEAAHPGQEVELVMKSKVHAGEQVYLTVDDHLLKEARQSYHKEVSRVPVRASVRIYKDRETVLVMEDDRNNRIEIKAMPAEEAINRPLDLERVQTQMDKTGGTPFYMADLQIDLEEGVSLPMRVLNGARREALEQLTDMRKRWYDREKKKPCEASVSQVAKDHVSEEGLIAEVRTRAQAEAVLEQEPDGLIMRAFVDQDILERAKDVGVAVYYAPGRICRNSEYGTLEKWTEAFRQADGVYAATWGQVQWLKDHGIVNIYADWSLNVFNSFSIDAFMEMGVRRITASPELTLQQVRGLRTIEQLELVAYGYQPVMITEYCPISQVLEDGKPQCGACAKGNFGLKDKTGAIFPIIRSDGNCRTEILNSKRLLMEHLDALYQAGANALRVVFTIESPEEAAGIMKLYQNTVQKQLESEDYNLLMTIKENATNGHYFRGVLGE